MQKQHKIILVWSLVFITVSLVCYVLYNLLTFRVVSTSPKLNSEVPSSTSSIQVNFNKKLSAQNFSLGSIESRGLVRSFSIKDKQLTLHLGSLDSKSAYEILIKEISSEKGQKKQNIALKFTTKYVEFGELSKDQQAQQINDTDPPSLATLLPYETSNYAISYSDIGRSKPTIYIDMKFNSRNPDDPTYLSNVRTFRNQALAYLKSKNLDVKDYYFEYGEAVLTEEFPGTYSDEEHDHDHDTTEDYTGDGVPPEQQPR